MKETRDPKGSCWSWLTTSHTHAGSFTSELCYLLCGSVSSCLYRYPLATSEAVDCVQNPKHKFSLLLLRILMWRRYTLRSWGNINDINAWNIPKYVLFVTDSIEQSPLSGADNRSFFFKKFSVIYETWNFITVFTRVSQWSLFWGSCMGTFWLINIQQTSRLSEAFIT